MKFWRSWFTSRRLPWRVVKEYSDTISKHGPDSPEAESVREKHKSVNGFARFSEAADSLKRRVGGKGIDS